MPRDAVHTLGLIGCLLLVLGLGVGMWLGGVVLPRREPTWSTRVVDYPEWGAVCFLAQDDASIAIDCREWHAPPPAIAPRDSGGQP